MLNNYFSTVKWLAISGLLCTNFFWAGNAVLARFIRDDIASFDLNVFRWSLALIILTPFALPKLIKDKRKIIIHLPKLLIIALLGVTFFNWLLYQSAHTTLALNIGLINSLIPIFTLAFSIPILKLKPNYLIYLSILFGLTGALLVIFKANIENVLSLQIYVGDALMLFAAFIWGLYTVLIKKWSSDIHPISTLWLIIVLGLGILLIISLFIGLPQINPQKFEILIPAIIYIAICPALLAYLFWNYGIGKMGAPISAVFLYTNPVFIAILSYIFLDEGLYWYHAFAGGFILIALIMAYKASLKNVLFNQR